jgi:undecaprenyl-diphosphatase
MNPAVLSTQSNLLATFLASILIWLLFAGLFFLWLVDGKVKKEQALHALLATLIAWSLSQMIKGLFPSLRPFYTNGHPPLTVTIPSDSTFPSGHTSAAFALAASIWLHDKKAGFLFIVGAVLVGVGRVLGNVHYYIDIFVGVFIGVTVAIVLEHLHVDKLLEGKRRR